MAEYGVSVHEINLDDLLPDDELEGVSPDKDFIQSVSEFNIIYPIILTKLDGNLVLVDGRRRVKAARKLGYKTIRALIFDNLSIDDVATWSLILNDQRSQNIITEYQYISQLATKENWEELQKTYGFNKAHVEKVLTLSRITRVEDFISALESGKITENTLFEIAKLGPSRQKYIRSILDTKGKVTLSDVKEAQKLDHVSALSSMPVLDESLNELLKSTEPIMQFAVLTPSSSNTATLYSGIQEAYAAMENTPGAKLYRLVEVT